MLDFGKKCYGTVLEMAEIIYNDLKEKRCEAWSFATSNYYLNDDELLNEIEDTSLEEATNDFEGWGGCNVLKDYRYDGTDMVLIGDQYGGGSFATTVLPEGIRLCEHYQPRKYWIEKIAQMICKILDAINGDYSYQFDAYICLEIDY